jgi:hypothetical protein
MVATTKHGTPAAGISDELPVRRNDDGMEKAKFANAFSEAGDVAHVLSVSSRDTDPDDGEVDERHGHLDNS